MFLNYFLTIALLLSTFFALFSASHAEAGNALIVGASAAVSFTLELLGAVCLWSAVMELLERSGAVKALTRLLAPLLRRLFPLSSRDGGIMAAGVKDSRWAIPAALCADLACFLSSAWICRILWG